MRKAFTTIFAFGILVTAIIFTPVTTQAQQNARDLMNKSIKAIDGIQNVRFDMKRKERFGSKFVNGEFSAKLQISPRKIYLKNKYPDKDAEVLHVAGKYSGKARVNPAKFPYVNLNLGPHGSLLMNDQHHSLYELGFAYAGKIVSKSFEKYGDKFDKYVSYKGTETFAGRKCHVVEINFTDFGWESYTVKSGEDLFDIGGKLVVSEILIMEKNGIRSFDGVKAGQTIKVPNAFAKKSILYIDAENFLPIVQEVHDEKGIFERYEFTNVKLNAGIKDAEFTEDYPGYGF